MIYTNLYMAEPFRLGDIFIGDFPITQNFGARPEVYFARYKLKGHNGLDFGCPSNTPLVAAADGWVIEAGFDAGGYGNYIKVVHDGYFTLYAHLNDILVHVKDKVFSGQLIGHSNNTGFSDGPHLHFGVAPCDVNGIKTEIGNGYSGYIDPLGSRCKWETKKITAPVVPSLDVQPDVPVKAREFVDLRTKSSNFDVVGAYFHLKPIELIDPKAGEKIVEQIVILEKRKQELERENGELQKKLPVETKPADAGESKEEKPVEKPTKPVATESGTPVLYQDVGTLFAKVIDAVLRLLRIVK